MDTTGLKKFAQEARTTLRSQVSAKLNLVLAPESAARRESPAAVQRLEKEISNSSRDQVIEKVAYTWFNRFTALRFMDANGLNETRVVSPADGQSRPEILSEAIAGNIGSAISEKVSSAVRALLEGRSPSADPQGEAYKLLLVAACNGWHAHMPFMFEEIADYTELLLPDDLLAADSLLAQLRAVMHFDACQDVEIIGWLYQFYISEKKDEVFARLKKNQKITPENIPAATQLFTPHWIVRYLVENSLGRLWLLNRPGSQLATKMDYYIAPEEPETDFLRIASPEEIKICDPACGSGHMLTYAFDLLFAIYEEEGSAATAIPGLILKHNLYGIEIDDRAGALAAFALSMKAAAALGRRRWTRLHEQPNVCVVQNVNFTNDELTTYIAAVGRDLFTADLRDTLGQFSQAKNFGSLITPQLKAVVDVAQQLEAMEFDSNLFLRDVHARVIQVLSMAEFLCLDYQVVVANPPYKKKGDLNPNLQTFLVSNFPDSFSDLYAAFIDRVSRMTRKLGYLSMVSMDSWLFGDDYTSFRSNFIKSNPIVILAHLGPRAFDEIKGEVVQVAAFVNQHFGDPETPGVFLDLTRGQNASEKAQELREQLHKYVARTSDFESLPRSVIAYFVSDHTRESYRVGRPLKEIAEAFTGLQTGDNPRFIRLWSEVNYNSIDFHVKPNENYSRKGKWVPYVKGSNYRKWFGNHEFVLYWDEDGADIKNHPSSTVRNESHYFNRGLAYNTIANRLSVRLVGEGHVFDQKNSMFFASTEKDLNFSLAFLHSKAVLPLLRVVASKDFGPGSMKLLPVIKNYQEIKTETLVVRAVSLAECDWNSFETSWEFSRSPFLANQNIQYSIADTYFKLRDQWRADTEEMKKIEEENNRVFIEAYGLIDELMPEVGLEDITLTTNPTYRYGGKKSNGELESLLLADTMREFLSYAVGCMFGRYSLDAPGFILANQGDGITDYLSKIPEPTFLPDADNVIPMLDDEWFSDDVTERFRRFLIVTFGEEKFAENLAFIENALGKDIRKYFTRDFFNDHVKRYKKRPIYWLFSSPKGTFNALIYMHRYRPDTVSVLLNDYLREFRSKLEAQKTSQEKVSISTDATQGQRTAALKEIQTLAKQIDELDAWERDVIYPLASQKIEIDLDDGVKVNYQKFEGALKPIKGLSDADD